MDMRVARLLANRKQLELQKSTGIHQSRISAIENNLVVPTATEKKKIEKALDCPIDWGDEG